MLDFFGARLRFKYHIDRIGPDGIDGWAFNRSHQKACRIEILTLDKQPLASGVTNILRTDIDNRTCGFRLKVDTKQLMTLTPGRFMLLVDGVKVSSMQFFAPIDASVMERELIERNETLSGLKADRLERENEYLSLRIAELENQLAQHPQDRPHAR
mgnify:CR=1 FL=1